MASLILAPGPMITPLLIDTLGPIYIRKKFLCMKHIIIWLINSAIFDISELRFKNLWLIHKLTTAVE